MTRYYLCRECGSPLEKLSQTLDEHYCLRCLSVGDMRGNSVEATHSGPWFDRGCAVWLADNRVLITPVEDWHFALCNSEKLMASIAERRSWARYRRFCEVAYEPWDGAPPRFLWLASNPTLRLAMAGEFDDP